MTATPPRLNVSELLAALEATPPAVLLDIRDPVEAERGHIPGATVLPRRSIEYRMASLVCQRDTPVIVYGGSDARAEWAAGSLRELGYTNVAWLDGGVNAWCESGHTLTRGNNVPSKAFGERVQHQHAVPSISAQTLIDWQRAGRNIAICDVRTPDEHRQSCIPGSVSIPSFDIALHAADLADRHDTLVLHCAGRTRSIVGTRSLIELGLTNVFALENGTMGWLLAGLELEHGSTRSQGNASQQSRDRAEQSAMRLAAEAGVRRIDGEALSAQLALADCHHAVFDVRSIDEHIAGHIAGCTALPGGQAVQRADDFIAVRDSSIVLVDELEARANLTGAWLRRMGYPDVAVLAGGMQAWRAQGRAVFSGRSRQQPLGLKAARAIGTELQAEAFHAWHEANPQALILHVDTSMSFRRGHLPGATWLPRGWLEIRINELAPARQRPLLLCCANGQQSDYAARTLHAMGYTHLYKLVGGTSAASGAGLVLQAGDLAPQDDELLAPYQRGEQAMRDYLDWETLLFAGSAVPGKSAEHSIQPDPTRSA